MSTSTNKNTKTVSSKQVPQSMPITNIHTPSKSNDQPKSKYEDPYGYQIPIPNNLQNQAQSISKIYIRNQNKKQKKNRHSASMHNMHDHNSPNQKNIYSQLHIQTSQSHDNSDQHSIDDDQGLYESYINIDSIQKKNPDIKVNSPRTLEACKAEGILPSDLTFKPLDSFLDKKKSREVSVLRYTLFEKKRQELIEIVKKARFNIINHIDSRSIASTSKSQGSHTRHKSISTVGGNGTSPNNYSSKALTTPLKPKYSLSKKNISMSDCSSTNFNTGRLDNEFLASEQRNVEKIKEREFFLIQKLLKNEELKNDRFTQMNRIREEAEEKMKRRELQQQKEKKKLQEAKWKKELEDIKRQQDLLKIEKREAYKKLQEELKEAQIQKRIDDERKKKQIIILQEKEKIRKLKSQQAQKYNQEFIRRSQEKMKLIQHQNFQRNKIIQNHQQRLKYIAQLKKEEQEAIKERVIYNIHLEEQRRKKEYQEKKMEEIKREEALKQKKENTIQSFKSKGEVRNIKIHKAVEESKKILQSRTEKILKKQEEVTSRIEQQRKKNQEKEELKKEARIINNELKKLNVQRKKRKEEYATKQIVEKLKIDDQKRKQFIKTKETLKEMRLKNLFQAEMQREEVREALHYMAVWNQWDLNIIYDLLHQKERRASSVENIIRTSARNCQPFSFQRKRLSSISTARNQQEYEEEGNFKNEDQMAIEKKESNEFQHDKKNSQNDEKFEDKEILMNEKTRNEKEVNDYPTLITSEDKEERNQEKIQTGSINNEETTPTQDTHPRQFQKKSSKKIHLGKEKHPSETGLQISPQLNQVQGDKMKNNPSAHSSEYDMNEFDKLSDDDKEIGMERKDENDELLPPI